MSKYIKTIGLLTIFLFISTGYSYCTPYYDLRFEVIETRRFKGEYENLIESINLNTNKNNVIIMDKTYTTRVSKELNKDEEDAIKQVLGSSWKSEIQFKGTKYTKIRPVYNEVTGSLVRKYPNFEKKENIKIYIPVDFEYNLNTLIK